MVFLEFAESVIPPPPQKLEIASNYHKTTLLSGYLELETWTPEEAAYLLNGIHAVTVNNPECSQIRSLSNNEPLSDPNYHLNWAKSVLRKWYSQLNPPLKVFPIDFINWCRKKNIETGWITNADEWKKYEAKLNSEYESKDIRGGVMSNSDWYTLALKKDLWAEFEVTGLFECPDERACIRLLGLIRTSVDAKKLIPVGQKNVEFYCNNGYWYYFKPSDIINWAISKEIPLPPRLQEWWEKQNKPIEQSGAGIIEDNTKENKAAVTSYEDSINFWTKWASVPLDLAVELVIGNNPEDDDRFKKEGVRSNFNFLKALAMVHATTYPEAKFIAKNNSNKWRDDPVVFLSEFGAWSESKGYVLPEHFPVINNQDENKTEDEANGNGRRNNQIDLICSFARQFDYELLSIPEGGKGAIKTECLKNSIFTDSGFDHAWKEANKRNLISMKDKEKYL